MAVGNKLLHTCMAVSKPLTFNHQALSSCSDPLNCHDNQRLLKNGAYMSLHCGLRQERVIKVIMCTCLRV